ncbi:fibronectin type III domain-containing protein [Neolewinella lacunae]|uniref:Fibronectin type III domain-containing protein n=1 Tax=Neolewinella lacunae TaxID=1517758 RepID=A0A923T5Z9_9BACT|nr:fibronectin type III domain-containing protein [Neolewinella lacunae]MBC6992875.1 fibronectin type III domain-containing protein [Neolewinella lacunae]MDN3633761.1 fibronectin type III domain-containing protein [Neolewinella lacunae]
MKFISKFLFVCLLCCCGMGLAAQSSITVMTQAQGTRVRLRWQISDPQLWLQANENGYIISRMTRAVNGQVLSLGDQAASRVVLRNNLKPRNESGWASTDLEQAAKKLLYDDVWNITPDGEFDFADAVAAEESMENRLFFAHALADRNWSVAIKLALAFVDNAPAANTEYNYVVSVIGVSGASAGALGGLGQSVEALVPVSDVVVVDGDTTVRVGWSVAETETLYTAYNIYRSPANAFTFVQVNEAPFIYGASDPENDPKFAWFTDSVPVYGEYKYQIRGLTPFGFTGPKSVNVNGRSRPGPLNLVMRMDSVAATETALVLHWESVTGSHDAVMVAQRIYRAESVKGPFEVVSAPTLAVSARQWTDPAPLPAAYYSIELEDQNGHLYRTQPQLGQLEDSTPPAAPSGFTGVDRGDGTILLQWNPNSEADLKGYRVLRCYARGGDFAPVEVNVRPDTFFVDDLRGVIVNDSIFYQLLAEDGRANASEKTPVLVVPRVDITPPGKPVLARVNATPAGIALSWKYSSDSDVVRHELQRRPSGSGSWTTVVTIPAGAEDDFVVENFDASGSINYLDDDEALIRQNYDYQFIAFDEMELGAGSEIVTLRPHDDGSRGEILDLAIGYACADSTITTDLDETVGTLMTNIIAAQQSGGTISTENRKAVLLGLEMSGLITATQFDEWLALTDAQFAARLSELYGTNGPKTQLRNCRIELEWSYPLSPGVLHFQVLRSRRGSRLRPYKALPVAYFFDGPVPTGRQLLSWADTDAEAGIRYVYKVLAVHADGGYSQESAGVTVVVE